MSVMAPQEHERRTRQDGLLLQRREDDEQEGSFSSLRSSAEDEEPTAQQQAAKSSSSARAATVAALCLCMLTHSYLLISVFPYSGFLVMELLEGIPEDKAGQYAGLIASAFMVGRATTSFAWGKAADVYGRTSVLYASLILSCFFSVLFGITPFHSFTVALLIRFCLGCSNGIMGSIKTIVSEISDENTEARTMGMVIGMWGWGFLISPAISGALAEPVQQYPDADFLAKHTFAGDLLRTFPFLLPNLLGAAACLMAIAMIRCFLSETLPEDQRQRVHLKSLFQRLVQCYRRDRGDPHYQALPVLKHHESDPRILSFDDDGSDEQEESNAVEEKRSPPSSATMASLFSRTETRKCLCIYWCYAFVGLTVDEAFPLFCLSHTAGFGLPEKEIGKVLSICGLIFVIAQYFVYSTVERKYGLHGSIRVGAALSAPVLSFIPLSLLLNKGTESGELNRWTFFYLGAILAMYRSFSMVFFTSISVATNRTVPVAHRAAMNGLTVLGGSVAKALGPTFAGVLTTVSVAVFGRFASVVIFGTIGLLGLSVTIGSFLFLPDREAMKNDDDCNSDDLDSIPVRIELKTKQSPPA